MKRRGAKAQPREEEQPPRGYGDMEMKPGFWTKRIYPEYVTELTNTSAKAGSFRQLISVISLISPISFPYTPKVDNAHRGCYFFSLMSW